MSDRVGQQIGNYRLISILGHGGFADVYLGEHIYLHTQAAIKILETPLLQEDTESFIQEAQTIAQLEHHHIVRVLDFGVEEHTPFLVMNYATNGSLRQKYIKGSKIPIKTVVTYVHQIAEALQYAHDKKIIHRDIKPENMLIGRNNEILLSDFGLAVVAQSRSHGGKKDVAGTVVYMAPEQARGKPDIRSDQYALAITIYEWLSGQRPFSGTYEEVIVQHAFTKPAALNGSIAEISEEQDQVIQKALEKDPHNRYSSIKDFAQALENASYKVASEAYSTSPSMTETQGTLNVSGEATIERSQKDLIYTVAWSPDKLHIAYGGHDRTIQVKGATTGICTLIYRAHTGGVTALAWSPDGRYIASTSLDRTIQVWDTTTGENKATYFGHNGMVTTLAWSPNGQYIASTSSGGTDNTIHIWYAATGVGYSTYKGHTHWVRAIAWSPNGNVIASGSWHEIQIWDSMMGQRINTYKGHQNWVRSINWSPQGMRIASAGEDNSVQIWEPLNKGHLIHQYRGHTDWVNTVLWSPDGAWLASASRNNSVHIWNADDINIVIQHHIRTHSAFAITWLPDNKHIASASGSGSIQVCKRPATTDS